MEWGPRRVPNALALALLAGLWMHVLASVVPTWTVGVSDFVAYYRAGGVVLAGETERLYEPGEKGFGNLPVMSLALAPLASLDYGTAWRVFWLFQLLCYGSTFGVLLWGIARFFPPLTPMRAALAGAIFLCFAPLLRRSLAIGQLTPTALLALALTWWLARAGRPRSAGAALGLACLVKVPPVLLLGVFLLRRRLSLVATALGVVAGAVLLSWLLFGGESLRQFADLVFWSNAGGSSAAYNNRGLDAAFTRLLTDRSLLDWYPKPRPLAVTLATAGVALALVGGMAWCGRGLLWPPAPPRDDDARLGSLELELALGGVLMVLVFPIVWAHYYLLLAVPAVLLPFWWQQRGLGRHGIAIALLVLGGWLASGSEVPDNVEAGARRHEAGFRAAQSAQTLGAVLCALGLFVPLGSLGRRAAAARGATPPTPPITPRHRDVSGSAGTSRW